VELEAHVKKFGWLFEHNSVSKSQIGKKKKQ